MITGAETSPRLETKPIKKSIHLETEVANLILHNNDNKQDNYHDPKNYGTLVNLSSPTPTLPK